MKPFRSSANRSGRQVLAAGLLYLVLLGTVFVPKWLSGYSFLTEVIWDPTLLVRRLLAGVFPFLLARSLPLRFLPALFAGMAYMLCGYFRIFLNFQHLHL